jgi:regulatory protein
VRITDIKQQVKRKDRYSIFIDGKFSFALSESELLAKGLRAGQELDDHELSSLKDDAQIDKAVYSCLNLIARRPRSRWEIENYLKTKKYSTDQIATLSQILEKKRYINDLNFALAWIANRRLLKSTSKRKLSLELKQKRISEEIIQQALEADETNEQDVLKELIAKKRTQSRYADEQKLIAYLARQGFRYDDIKTALNGE